MTSLIIKQIKQIEIQKHLSTKYDKNNELKFETDRSCRHPVFCNKGVLKNFAKSAHTKNAGAFIPAALLKVH